MLTRRRQLQMLQCHLHRHHHLLHHHRVAAGLVVDAMALRRAELPSGATNVSLMGSDHDEVGNHYCYSIPIEKCIEPFSDTIIAYEMNCLPIPRQHGYPFRGIIPGHAGARNCKFIQHLHHAQPVPRRRQLEA